METTILWRRLDLPGHEWARLRDSDAGWCLEGVAVMSQGGRPCRLDYHVSCDRDWFTTSARISGWIADARIDMELTADRTRQWTLDGVAQPAVAGCLDVDLGFSPSTNVLPIRRLALPVGGVAPVRAAWVRFPEMTVEPLEQVYRRTAVGRYAYESAGGAFRAALEVDEAGLVTSYEGLWVTEATS